MKVNIYLETDKQCQACIQRKYGYVIEIMHHGQIVTREGFGCVVSTYHQCNLQALAEALARFHSSCEICIHTKDTFVASRVLRISDLAALGFTACYKMVQQSPLLSKHIKKRASDLYFKQNFGFIKALASNTNSLDGLDVHGGVIDELAAIKNRDIYDLVKQAMGARRQPLLFCITTNGFIRNGIFDAQYDYAAGILEGKIQNNRFIPFIYELDDREEWDKEECWEKANPGLGPIKSYDYLRQMVQKAKDDPTFKPTVCRMVI